MQKLNLGCGTDIRAGYINLDSVSLPGVDVVHDIEILPLPFEDNSFDEIICMDVLEHVEYIPVLKDLHRILKQGGILKIRVPHFSSANAYGDPTHKKFFTVRTFDFFVRSDRNIRPYYFDFSFSSIDKVSISFVMLLVYTIPVYYIVNLSSFFQVLYEQTFMKGLFPAENVHVTFTK